MGLYEIDHAEIAGKFENAIGFQHVAHAEWRLIYADGTRSNFAVIALSWELEARGLVEMPEGR